LDETYWKHVATDPSLIVFIDKYFIHLDL